MSKAKHTHSSVSVAIPASRSRAVSCLQRHAVPGIPERGWPWKARHRGTLVIPLASPLKVPALSKRQEGQNKACSRPQGSPWRRRRKIRAVDVHLAHRKYLGHAR